MDDTSSQENLLYDRYVHVRFESFTHMHARGNRPHSAYSRYWTGTSLQLRLTRGFFSNANNIYLLLMIFRRMSLHCKLVPVQYREYEYGPLKV